MTQNFAVEVGSISIVNTRLRSLALRLIRGFLGISFGDMAAGGLWLPLYFVCVCVEVTGFYVALEI